MSDALLTGAGNRKLEYGIFEQATNTRHIAILGLQSTTVICKGRM
jgi:hypothetical protein